MTLEQMTLFGEPLHFLGGTMQRRETRTRRRGGSEKRQGTGQGRHDNSLAAHGDARLQAALTGRRAEIVAWLREHGPATVREIVSGMYFDGADMNLVRPRVTELLDSHDLVEVDKVRDPVTGMMVGRVDIKGRAA